MNLLIMQLLGWDPLALYYGKSVTEQRIYTYKNNKLVLINNFSYFLLIIFVYNFANTEGMI